MSAYRRFREASDRLWMQDWSPQSVSLCFLEPGVSRDGLLTLQEKQATTIGNATLQCRIGFQPVSVLIVPDYLGLWIAQKP